MRCASVSDSASIYLFMARELRFNDSGRCTTSTNRVWACILYPENMLDNWRDCIGDIIQRPYCYCVHDKDFRNKYNAPEERKIHIHLMVAYGNNTSENAIYNLVIQLSKDPINRPCAYFRCISVEPKYYYNYLIHDTESAKKQGKYQYDPKDRICGNNFDIGILEQLSLDEINEISHELTIFMRTYCFTDFASFQYAVIDNFDSPKYEEIARKQHGYFANLAKGNFHQRTNNRYISIGKEIQKREEDLQRARNRNLVGDD